MKKSQFLNSLMDKRLYFSLKRCGFEFSSISFFFLLFNLLVCSTVFFILCSHGYIYLNLAYVYSTNTNMNNFNKPKFNNSLRNNSLDDFNTFVVICCLFLKIIFSKYLSGTLSKCQTVCIQIRTDVLSVLIWEQTVN